MRKERELTDAEIRRLFITDKQWNRTHASWKALKPLRNFNEFRESDETEEAHSARTGIPFDVVDQWLYCHYYNDHTVDNYGWIDYSRVEFQLQRWPTARLEGLRIIDDYRPFVDERSAMFASMEEFYCTERDLEHWQAYRTWRVPPVAIDTDGLGRIPRYSDVIARFQLIEGHSRMGYLRALAQIGRSGGVSPAEEHGIYVLTATR